MSYCLLLGYYNFSLMHCSWDINSARGASQNKKNKKKKTLESKTHYWFNNQGIRYALLIVTFWQWSVGGSFYFHINFWVKQPWILVVRMNGWTSTNICIWTLVLLESRESRVSHMDVNSKQRSGHQIQGFTPGVLSPVEPGPTKKAWALFANVQAIFI